MKFQILAFAMCVSVLSVAVYSSASSVVKADELQDHANEEEESSNTDQFAEKRQCVMGCPHPLKIKVAYRLWSVVSRVKGSYLKKTSSTGVSCSGTAKTADDDLTLVTAHFIGRSRTNTYRLVLKNPTNPSNWYVITGASEGAGVYLQDVPKNTTPPKDDESLFEPKYFWENTAFRCYNVNGRRDLYIGSDENGQVTMMKKGTTEYPNPAALFRLVKHF